MIITPVAEPRNVTIQSPYITEEINVIELKRTGKSDTVYSEYLSLETFKNTHYAVRTPPLFAPFGFTSFKGTGASVSIRVNLDRTDDEHNVFKTYIHDLDAKLTKLLLGNKDLASLINTKNLSDIELAFDPQSIKQGKEYNKGGVIKPGSDYMDLKVNYPSATTYFNDEGYPIPVERLVDQKTGNGWVQLDIIPTSLRITKDKRACSVRWIVGQARAHKPDVKKFKHEDLNFVYEPFE